MGCIITCRLADSSEPLREPVQSSRGPEGSYAPSSSTASAKRFGSGADSPPTASEDVPVGGSGCGSVPETVPEQVLPAAFAATGAAGAGGGGGGGGTSPPSLSTVPVSASVN
eukprot:RCo007377